MGRGAVDSHRKDNPGADGVMPRLRKPRGGGSRRKTEDGAAHGEVQYCHAPTPFVARQTVGARIGLYLTRSTEVMH